MRRLRALLVAVLAGGVLAPAATAGQPAVSVVEPSASESRNLASAPGTRKFTLVGVHWRGQGRVLFRTRSLGGTWSTWRPAAPEAEDGPSRGSPELRKRAGWRVGNPWWVGPSDRIAIRRIGRVGRVRAFLVWSPAVEVPIRRPTATVDADDRPPPLVGRQRVDSWRPAVIRAENPLRGRAPHRRPKQLHTS